MLDRALTLYRTFLLEILHRLRHDWARELVVLTASLVLFATFFYIFNDFLNVEIASLSTVMRDKIAWGFAVLAWILAAVVAGRAVRTERRSDQSLAHAARLLGETDDALTLFTTLRTVTVLAAVHGAVWVLVCKALVRPALEVVVGIEAAMIVVSLMIGLTGTARATPAALQKTTDFLPGSGGIIGALTSWRWVQMTKRNRLTRLTMMVGVGLLVLTALAGARGAPPFAVFVMCLAAGYVTGIVLVLQLADDLPNAWTERGHGVTHTQFVAAYERLGLRLGMGLGTVGALLLVGGRVASTGAFSSGVVLEGAKALVVIALPAIMTPWLMFQIEGRRAGVNAILVLIATLFIGTAVYANWLSLLLPLLLRYYAMQYQTGRFYRA